MERLIDDVMGDGGGSALDGCSITSYIDSAAHRMFSHGGHILETGAPDPKRVNSPSSRSEHSSISASTSRVGETVNGSVSEPFSRSINEYIRGVETLKEVTAAHVGGALANSSIDQRDACVLSAQLLISEQLLFDQASHHDRSRRSLRNGEGVYTECGKPYFKDHSSNVGAAAETVTIDTCTRDGDDVLLASSLTCFKDLFQTDCISASHTSTSSNSHNCAHDKQDESRHSSNAAVAVVSHTTQAHASDGKSLPTLVDGSNASGAQKMHHAGHHDKDGCRCAAAVCGRVAEVASRANDDCHAANATAPQSTSSYPLQPLSSQRILLYDDNISNIHHACNVDEDCSHGAEEDVMTGMTARSSTTSSRLSGHANDAMSVLTNTTEASGTSMAGAETPTIVNVAYKLHHHVETASQWLSGRSVTSTPSLCSENEENEELLLRQGTSSISASTNHTRAHGLLGCAGNEEVSECSVHEAATQVTIRCTRHRKRGTAHPHPTSVLLRASLSNTLHSPYSTIPTTTSAATSMLSSLCATHNAVRADDVDDECHANEDDDDVTAGLSDDTCTGFSVCALHGPHADFCHHEGGHVGCANTADVHCENHHPGHHPHRSSSSCSSDGGGDANYYPNWDGDTDDDTDADGVSIHSPSCRWSVPDFCRAGGIARGDAADAGYTGVVGRTSHRPARHWGANHARIRHDSHSSSCDGESSSSSSAAVPAIQEQFEETTLSCTRSTDGSGWPDGLFTPAASTSVGASPMCAWEQTAEMRMCDDEEEQHQLQQRRRDGVMRMDSVAPCETHLDDDLTYATLLCANDQQEHEQEQQQQLHPHCMYQEENDEQECGDMYEAVHEEEDGNDYTRSSSSPTPTPLPQWRRKSRSRPFHSFQSSTSSSSMCSFGEAMANVRAALQQCPPGVHPFLNMTDQHMSLAAAKKSRHELYCARMIQDAFLSKSDLVMSSKMLLNCAHKLHISRTNSNTTALVLATDTNCDDATVPASAACSSSEPPSFQARGPDSSGSTAVQNSSDSKTNDVDPHNMINNSNDARTEHERALANRSFLCVRATVAVPSAGELSCEGAMVTPQSDRDNGAEAVHSSDVSTALSSPTSSSTVGAKVEATLLQSCETAVAPASSLHMPPPLLCEQIAKINEQWRHISTLVGEDMQEKDHIFVQRQISCMCMFDPNTDYRLYGGTDQTWTKRHASQIQILNRLANQTKNGSKSLFLE